MNFNRAVILFLLYVLCENIARGQSPIIEFRHLTGEQGLSNSTVQSITQDNLGFIWVGTNDGLNRYDGNSFEVFRNNISDSTTISDNFITCVFEDHENALWVGTMNGLSRYDRITHKFVRLRLGSVSSTGNDVINSISEDQKGQLWIGTLNAGLILIDQDRYHFTRYLHDAKILNSLSDNTVNAVFFDSTGRAWIATNGGLDIFIRASKTFVKYKIIPSDSDVGDSNVTDVKVDNRGNLWVGTYNSGLIMVNLKSGKYFKFLHKENDNTTIGSDLIKRILIDHNGNIWIACINGGLNLYNAYRNNFFSYHHGPEDKTTLSQKSVFSLLEDKQGNLWVGTPRGGINLYTPNSIKFKSYHQKISGSGLSYDDVRAFFQDNKGNIWIGTDGGGINLFNEKNESFIHYKNDPNNSGSLSSNAVLDITGDRLGNIWIATFGGGLNMVNRVTRQFKHYVHNPADNKTISSDFVEKVFEDNEGRLWIGTYNAGLNLYDPKSQKFTRIGNSNPVLKSSLGNFLIDINEDKDGNLWVLSLDKGITRYNLKTGKYSHYLIGGRNPRDNVITFIDSRNNLWVGAKGLYIFDKVHNQFKLYTNKGNLSAEFIKGIEEDGFGNLWISTSEGLTEFNPQSLAFKKFNTGDGLEGLEFEVRACLKAKDGKMFFGGLNGFNTFFPDKIVFNKFIPPVYINEFEINNKPIKTGRKGSPLQSDINFSKSIYLKYDQSTFSFSFSALNFIVPENNEFKYKLEPFDKDWIKAGSEHKATYTNIGSGSYVFHVIASNNDGLWNNVGRSVPIVIMPPYWATWWFKTLIILVILFTIMKLLAFKRKTEIEEIEERNRQKMLQDQMQFFTNISHEFRTPLSLILGPLEKIGSEDSLKFSHYYAIIQRNANRLMELINELMDFRKVTSGVLKLRVKQGNLNEYLRSFVDEFKHFSIDKKISLYISDEASFTNVWFDDKVLEKIILNLLNNAFKYTDANGIIRVEIFSDINHLISAYENELTIKSEVQFPKYFYIRIKDNGIGISKQSIENIFERYYRVGSSHLGSGIGLAFVKNLVLLHKGNIWVYSERNIGTEIIVGLPLGESCYNQNEKWNNTNADDYMPFESVSNFGKFYEDLKFDDTVESTGIPQFNERVLLVDDNNELRSFIKDVLGNLYYTLEARDGNEALKIAKDQFPDLIISDIMMPGMNGIDLCKSIKNDIDTSHIPVVLLTAKEAIETKIEGIESGADVYLSKPINLRLLTGAIKNIFERREKLKERYNKDAFIEARDLVISTRDKDFMHLLLKILESQMTNPELDVEFLCSETGMSKTKLYQKIKNITGQSIAEFVRTFRLKKAVQIMTHEDVLLSEVTFRTGFTDASHFSRLFKKEFGKTPSQFLNDIKKVTNNN